MFNYLRSILADEHHKNFLASLSMSLLKYHVNDATFILLQSDVIQCDCKLL